MIRKRSPQRHGPLGRRGSVPNGHQRYVGRPLHFGPLDPNDLDKFLEIRAAIAGAEQAPEDCLSRYGLTGLEQWWHIEASFYQRHMLDDVDAARLGTTSGFETAMPSARQQTQTPPVSLEVFSEISGAQAAWAKQGLNPRIEASQHFLLELEELDEVELYWSAVLGANRGLARHFARRMLHYKAQFSGD